jgi:flagellar biosynthetic protein FliR
LRVSAFTFTWPIFSIYSVPGYCKILFALILAMTVFPTVSRAGIPNTSLSPDIAWLAAKEVLTGLCLGFMTRLFFFAISVGGNLVATASGLANGQLFNPSLGATTTTVEQFYGVLATLLFLSLNGHHIFLTGLAQSFELLPLSIDGTDFALMVGRFKDTGLILSSVVEAGIKISAPVLLAMFMLNVVMGIISRAVPQVNVLMTSMPINFLATILIMMIAIPALILELDHEMIAFAEQLFRFMKS